MIKLLGISNILCLVAFLIPIQAITLELMTKDFFYCLKVDMESDTILEGHFLVSGIHERNVRFEIRNSVTGHIEVSSAHESYFEFAVSVMQKPKTDRTKKYITIMFKKVEPNYLPLPEEESVQLVAYKLHKHLQAFAFDISQQQFNDEVHYNMYLENMSNVNGCSVFKCAIIIVVCIMQTMMITNYFKQHENKQKRDREANISLNTVVHSKEETNIEI